MGHMIDIDQHAFVHHGVEQYFAFFRQSPGVAVGLSIQIKITRNAEQIQ